MPTQSILLSLLSLTTLTTLATASSMKVQYYTDGGCTSYAVETYPFANWDCYNYSWGGSNSANIAACNPDYQGGICSCTFFTSSNCGGQGHTAEWRYSNCASNWGAGYKSMSCGVWYPDS